MAGTGQVLFPSSSSSDEALFSDESVKKGLRKIVRRPGQLRRSQVKRLFQISSSSSSGNNTPEAEPVLFETVTGESLSQSALPDLIAWPIGKRSIDFSALDPRQDSGVEPDDSLVCSYREVLLPPLGKYVESLGVSHLQSAIVAESGGQFGDPVDFIILFVHGIGGRDHKLARNIGLFREVMQKVKNEHFWDVKCEMHIELINWKQAISTVQNKMFERIVPPHSDQDVTSFRHLFNSTMADLGFYMTPVRKEAILNSAGDQINAAINKLKKGNPRRYRDSKLVLIGYSLGSVIVHDLLDAQSDQILTGRSVEMQAMDVAEPGAAELPATGIPVLACPVHAVYLFGSPLGSFISMRASNDAPFLDLPVKITNFYNIFHELDPIAFRLEPLFYRESAEDSAPPVKLTGSKEDEEGGSWLSKMFRKAEANGGSLPRTRRLDFMLPSQSTLASLPLIGKLALPVTMLPAHYVYWHDERSAFFLLKTLTAAQ